MPHWPWRHPSPDTHSVAEEQEQEPPAHVAVGPHCVLVVQAPQTPDVHTCPWLQSLFEAHAGVHSPAAHASPDAQSLDAVHVHWIVECVAVHFALGPHWLSDAHSVHAPPEQILPAAHSLFEVQGPVQEGSPLHATQAT